jgi:hypothetical protein
VGSVVHTQELRRPKLGASFFTSAGARVEGGAAARQIADR